MTKFVFIQFTSGNTKQFFSRDPPIVSSDYRDSTLKFSCITNTPDAKNGDSFTANMNNIEYYTVSNL